MQVVLAIIEAELIGAAVELEDAVGYAVPVAPAGRAKESVGGCVVGDIVEPEDDVAKSAVAIGRHISVSRAP